MFRFFHSLKNVFKSRTFPIFFTSLKFFFAACASVDGGWSGWTAWSGCAAGVCAGNQRIRTRTCTNPIPTEDGKYCDGDSAEQLDCLSEYYAKIVIPGTSKFSRFPSRYATEPHVKKRKLFAHH